MLERKLDSQNNKLLIISSKKNIEEYLNENNTQSLSSSQELKRNNTLIEKINSLHDGLLHGDNQPDSTPEFYTTIFKEYGNTNVAKFKTLHSRMPHTKSDIAIINFEGNILLPISETEFNKLLSKDAFALLKKYEREYRAQGKGGCFPISEEFAKRSGTHGTTKTIIGHQFNVINVEGVLYAVDLTFNQFFEKTVATEWGAKPMKGPNVGIIVMPITK